jgi:outer membrane protein insertion porin family
MMFIFCLTTSAYAQAFKISNVEVRGNIRIETATIESLLGLGEQSGLSAAELNDAIQDIRDSGLFESVLADVDDGSLIITVVENPTVNSVVFEGNNRLTDELLRPLVRTLPRRIYAISQVRDDANAIASAYADQGRISASVEPRIIRRSDNRVDVIFEIIEGGIVEIERISFVGNRSFSDRRLRRVIETKQAGLLRLLIRRDTFVKDRIEFDKQLLTDFYKQRGFVDFKILSVNSELSQTRDSFFVTFNIQEGQQFQFGKVDISTVLPGVNPADFEAALKVKKGQIYSPELVELTIARMERRALELGLDFVVVKPRESRNEKPLTMDLVLEMSQGPRIFIERINISGNTTTQDRVVRRQFQLVEGDPFNPRQIRRTADRIRN